ncbi:MAG: tyrosine-type recombinase/integrase [Clostridiaceae bacterium]|nr:tyrosine-type recombinase/integrase [Clostridiaceae bacterium]
MDLIKFKERYPIFISRMKELGYHGGYIEKYERMVRLILCEGGEESISTYEQFYQHMVNNHKYSECTCYEYRNQIGRLKVFVEDGVFLGDTGKWSGFLQYKSYNHLSLDFKCLIDSYIDIERKRGKRSESSIAYIISHTSSFFYCIQQSGVITLAGIKNVQTVLQAFEKGQKRHGSYNVPKSISTVLQTCMHLYPNGECRRIWGMIPEFPRRTRLYDNLQPDENEKVAHALDEDGSNLTYRSKAIGKLAYYTGMRRIDIANLRFENINLEKDEIRLIQQKTGLEVCIPLRSVVGNAIYDYIVNERPKCDSDYIFIRAYSPFIKLSSAGVSNDLASIFKQAGIRQQKGRKKGVHLFRHAFASDLIAKDTPINVVSKLLGHSSISSLNPYLDADTEHLRECALSIARFTKISNAFMEPFYGSNKAIIQQFVDHCIKHGIWCSDYNRALRSFDNYCVTFYPDASSLSQDILNQWCKPFADESRKAYLKRTSVISNFVSYLSSTYATIVVMPKSDNVEKCKRSSLMKIFTSTGAELFKQFVCHRKTSGCWSDVYEINLRSFDLHCSTLYPEATALTQEMVDTWCSKRQSENQYSRGKRIAVVNSFLKYAYNRGLLNLEWNSIPTSGPGNKVIKEPHVFTDIELQNFFFACDNIQISHNGLIQSLMKLTIPVFFRLLFSSGMRTNEVRNLNVEDVDLKHGVINIHYTKGYIEHRVALHTTMKERLVEYNTAINKLMPDRKCFFPNYCDKYYSLTWMEYNFEKLWYKYNHSRTTVYHLRHHYATTNINSWPSHTDKFNRNLLYLIKSMGHSTVETTMYYYNFTPKLAEILKKKKKKTFNEIIPNRKQYFIDYE